MHHSSKKICNLLTATFAAALFSATAFCQNTSAPGAFRETLFGQTAFGQTITFGPEELSTPEPPTTVDTPEPTAGVDAVPSFDERNFSVSSFHAGAFDDADGTAAAQPTEPQPGLVHRSVKRILEDQKGIYFAPFEPAHLTYDAIMLGGATVFFVTDHRIENNLPGGHYQLYQDSSNIAIGGLAATLGGVWLYGIKGDHPHARETGEVELETLVNTFLVYAPMQFIAARQRPGEGNGHGDFLKHPMINTSFPGGHAMFTWAMATVVAHEYSQPWVRVLNYTAAFTVTLTRFLARDHWASDMWVGTGLGLAIGTYTFHQRCDPDLSSSCKRHYERIVKKNTKSKLDYAPGSRRWNAELKSNYASGRPISQ